MSSNKNPSKHSPYHITVEKIQEIVPNIYEAVLLTAVRAHQIDNGLPLKIVPPAPHLRSSVLAFEEMSEHVLEVDQLRKDLLRSFAPHEEEKRAVPHDDSYDENETWALEELPAQGDVAPEDVPYLVSDDINEGLEEHILDPEEALEDLVEQQQEDDKPEPNDVKV